MAKINANYLQLQGSYLLPKWRAEEPNLCASIRRRR